MLSQPFLSVGFRPFYLAAAAFALLSVPLWIWLYRSAGMPPSAIPPMLWHSHEMLFGFASAVIVGFLLTAVRNWTGLPTAAGLPLATLTLLWLGARLANWFSPSPAGVLLDAAFLLTSLLLLAGPILRARNQRNYFVILLLAGLCTAAVLNGLHIRGNAAVAMAPRLAMDLILLLMIVIGGRVIPAFSANAVPELNPHTWLPLEVLVIGTGLALLTADLLAPNLSGPAWQAFCGLAAALHLARVAGWQAWRTVRNPLLLALPAAYLWIPAYFLLRGFEPALATHALTVGAMASLMLAMMTRSALGHSGRPLEARLPEVVCFAAVHLAALCRVAGPLLAPAAYTAWLWLAAGFWAIAFATFCVAYWPILTRPRLDAQTRT